ncbi:hypothetical protein [Spartinivicinus ruber]|uniref:hypothetical protein n=1 Tax=Spartinivicinus ruber TaxID=2683272 RepID=UPI0015B52838|nr:hypothetical protein [Spartinivicinus ruber]
MKQINNSSKQAIFFIAALCSGQVMSLPVEVKNNIITISPNVLLLNGPKSKEGVYKLIVTESDSTISFSSLIKTFNVVMSKEKDSYELKCTSYSISNVKNACVATISDKGLYYLKIEKNNDSTLLVNTVNEYKKNMFSSFSNTGFCYKEAVQSNTDISDLKGRFNRYNWLQTIQSVYQKRWKSGVVLVKAQANDPYFSQFVNKNSFNKMAESLMVAIHEETHMYDLDSNRTDWEQKLTAFVNQYWQPKVPIHGGFPRNEIIPLLESNVTKPWDDIYLRDSTQGSYLMQGVLSELNAGLTGLIGVAVVGEYVDGYEASNAMDSAAAYMYHLQLYLRQAKKAHVSYYNQLKSEKLFKDFILIQWLRLHYYIDIAKEFTKLGTDYQEILELLYRPNNVKAIEEVTGHSILLTGNKHCLPDDEPFEPPF